MEPGRDPGAERHGVRRLSVWNRLDGGVPVGSGPMVDEHSAVSTPAAGGAFGPNAWLVDDMYEEYRSDPSSVSESWREFFADYTPPGSPGPDNGGPPANGAPTSTNGAPGMSNGAVSDGAAVATPPVPVAAPPPPSAPPAVV